MKSTDDKKNTVKHWIGDRIATEKGEKNWVNIRIPNMVFDIHMSSGYSTQTAEVPFRKVGDECVTKRFIYSENN